MIAVAIAALAGRPMAMPAPLARVVFVLIGISLGGAVTPETLKGVATWPLSVRAAVRRHDLRHVRQRGLSEEGAWLDHAVRAVRLGAGRAVPGDGLCHRSTIRDLAGIAIVQTIRVVILTALLPVVLALFGLIPTEGAARSFAITDSLLEIAILVGVSSAAAILAHFVRFPGGLIFGAMLASAVLHGSGLIHAAMPWWIVSAVMVALGRADRIALRQHRYAGAVEACRGGARLVFGGGRDRRGVRGGRDLCPEPAICRMWWCRMRPARSTR